MQIILKVLQKSSRRSQKIRVFLENCYNTKFVITAEKVKAVPNCNLYQTDFVLILKY